MKRNLLIVVLMVISMLAGVALAQTGPTLFALNTTPIGFGQVTYLRANFTTPSGESTWECYALYESPSLGAASLIRADAWACR